MAWWDQEKHPVDSEVSRFLALKRAEEEKRKKEEEYNNSREGVLDWLKPLRVLRRLLKPTEEEVQMNTMDHDKVLKLKARLAREPSNEYVKEMLRDLGERVD